MTGRTGDDRSPPKSNLFSQTTDFIDRHLRVIRYVTVYGLAGAGIVVLLRSTYALRKFRDVKDVPREFIHRHVQLHGHVTRVTDKGQLIVNHTPVIAVRKGTEGQLPVTLAGVHLSPLAQPWLQTTFPNKHIWFKIIRITKDSLKSETHIRTLPYTETSNLDDKDTDSMVNSTSVSGGVDSRDVAATCDVTALMVRDEDDVLDCIVTAKRGWFRNMVVNEEVVRLGYATVSEVEGLEGDPDVTKLIKRLIKAEIKAEKKGYGMWERPSLKERIMNYPSQLRKTIVDYIKGIFSRKPKSGGS